MERDAPQSTPPATLCKAGCGFYGSPNFDSMCSKCFKEALKKKNQNPSQNDQVSNGATTAQASNNPSVKGGRASGGDGATAMNHKRKAEDEKEDDQSVSGEKTRRLTDEEHTEDLDMDKGTFLINASPSGTPSPSAASSASSILGTANATTAPLPASVMQTPAPLQSSASSSTAAPAAPVGIVPLPTSLETGTPTIPTVVTPGVSPNNAPEASGATSTEEGASSEAGSEDGDRDGKKPPKKNRCHECRKKVGLTGFECRCGGLFCSLHRYSDKHKCSFDYHALGAEQIRKANPVVVSEKVQKI